VSVPVSGYDEVVLTAPLAGRLCHSLACARAGTLAEVIVTYGVLNDPGACYHAPGALWRESWHKPVPMCGRCWQSPRQVAVTYRPRLAVTDATADGPAPVGSHPSGGRT
jgi:hypothetical protein